MKNLFNLLLVALIPLTFSFSQEDRNVLIEVFTNSHCTNCPLAHNTINNYLSASPDAERFITIFYHMMYPYPDDLLYQHNTIDSDGRDDYYNPVASTPRGFFDGQIQGNTSGWTSTLNNLITIESPLTINCSGTKKDDSFTVKAEITRTGNIPDDDLVIHFVVVEDVNYTGRNGISHHENVMRKMVDGAFGKHFSINMNETLEVERGVIIHNEWIKDNLKVVVFIQSDSSKTVYQSALISFSEFNDPTGTETENNLPLEYRLEQNYPNPFNPSTTISYYLPEDNFVTLKVYNLLGKEVSTIVNQKQTSGSYKYFFNADGLSSGIYFYKLIAVDPAGQKIIRTKKMTIIK